MGERRGFQAFRNYPFRGRLMRIENRILEKKNRERNRLFQCKNEKQERLVLFYVADTLL